MKAYREALKRLAEVKGFKPERRPLLEEAFDFLTSSDRPFLILNAPTGYGKTLLSFALALHSLGDASLFDRVIHVLPMRSIIEDIQRTAEETFGFSRTKMMGSSGEFLHLFPLNITTADTFTWDLLKLNTKKRHRIKAGKEFGYDYLTQASILTSLVIFDEAHFLLEDESMVTAFDAVVDFLTSNGVPVVVMTATLSRGHRELFEGYAKKNGYDFRILTPKEGDPFIERELGKEFSISFARDDHLKFVDPEKRNAVIVNTVDRAIKLYEDAKNDIGLGREKVLLIHGRMTPGHKRSVIERLRELKNGEFLLIGTQAIEAGVDFSADVMVTDAAPINSLLQRFGRVARHGGDKKGEIIIIDAPPQPYSKEKVGTTLKLLKEKGIHPRVPGTYQDIVSAVHGEKRSNVTRIIDRSHKAKLLNLMKAPEKRAPDVLSVIETMMAEGKPIMRSFLIPLSVNGEIVPITPKKLLELYSKGLLSVEGSGREIKDLNDAYLVAKDIALGRDINVVFVGEYDRERGIV
ncbi:CRISPR-associated helicase Cas3 [Thermococcus sp. P6]|uniref:CRISPR-associated helicase Cas3' n=1 Tax=Thermococcus sp. P6 TaxID=122420 RepID=UPI000B59E321|nr:CRISPR-associated helicase Cas3' [Thermococcus sp. P6]ASJ10960.1 CRISPR-associated helicase Cas3 [Thermococcus sp. P6]